MHTWMGKVQTGTQTKQRCLMLSSLRSSTPIIGSGSPKGVTMRMIDSQLTLNFLLHLDPFVYVPWWVGFILKYKSWLVSW